ncbi:hypothetical protein QBC43DRAFT_115348 [Cladorrhinum sp. PSN259]|nr:hypothetical protein QBC43DRAFT_115348 [Cladorrhinum sp. PSN259]
MFFGVDHCAQEKRAPCAKPEIETDFNLTVNLNMNIIDVRSSKMAWFCNYIPTEYHEIIDGQRFYHHREFCKLESASTFYGPGVVYCWYLLIFSVLLKWCVRDRPQISAELCVIVLYSVLAAVDLSVQSFQVLLGTEHRADGVECFISAPFSRPLEGTQMQRFIDNPLDYETLDFGQKEKIRLSALFARCYPLAHLCFLLWISGIDILKDEGEVARRWLRRGCLFVVCILAIF